MPVNPAIPGVSAGVGLILLYRVYRIFRPKTTTYQPSRRETQRFERDAAAFREHLREKYGVPGKEAEEQAAREQALAWAAPEDVRAASAPDSSPPSDPDEPTASEGSS